MRARWIAAALLLLALDVYLIAYHWNDVGGNVEAQFIISTPQFIALHLLAKRRAERHHAENQEALAAAHAKVTELHDQLTD